MPACSHVESYEVVLDLTDGGGKPSESTFRSTTTVRFSASRTGESTFLDVIADRFHSVTLNGADVDVSGYTTQGGSALTGLARRQRPRRRRRPALHEHRRGPAPLRRPARRRDVPVLAVRDGRREADVRLLRPARSQGGVHAHRHRARPLAGRRRTARSRARPTLTRGQDHPLRDHAADQPVHHRAGRRPVPRGARRARRHHARPVVPRVARAATSTRTSCSRSPSRASTGTTRTSACGTRSASTTSCSSRSSTPARWRTPAA